MQSVLDYATFVIPTRRSLSAKSPSHLIDCDIEALLQVSTLSQLEGRRECRHSAAHDGNSLLRHA
jgi:hypothetical protein